MKQLSVFLENKPGELTSMSDILRDSDISIDSVVIAETSKFGVVRIITSEFDKAADALKKAGFSARTVDVVAVKIANKKGTFAKIVEALSGAGISINYCYSYYADTNFGIFVFSLDDNEKGQNALSKAGFEVIK
ncbi:MAG: amino acid-binding protein [Campylobacter sp.]|nr:amino acid-binding protein [Campylobacter sp.]